MEKEVLNYHYYNRYIKFIKSRYSRTIPENSYTEIHHILPKCYGGTDSKSNLIELTAREHFIAHWLLWKFADKSMQRAFHMISHVSTKVQQERYKIKSSKVYSNLKEAISNNHNWKSNPDHPNDKRDMSGKNNGMYKKKHSEKSKKLMSIGHKGKIISEESKIKMSENSRGSLNPMFGKKGKSHPAYGLKRTDEQLKIMSEKSSGKNNAMAKPVIINNVEYDTIKQASEILCIHPATVRQRINSKSNKFKEWNYQI